MRAQMLNSIILNCNDFETFKNWYTKGSLHNPARDKLYLEAALDSNYFTDAKNLIVSYHDWGKEINERVKQFCESLN